MVDLAATSLHLLHQAFFGAVAAGGFGVLFNFGRRCLSWAIGFGAVALTVRTLALDAQWSLEAASFAAAFVTGALALVFRDRLGAAMETIALAGCIPMIPGAFFAHALLGFFALTAPDVPDLQATVFQSMQAFLRVVFTLGAIGAGLVVPGHLFRIGRS
ncbi:MAG: threonine/serine exporter family protein [Hyphomicrobiales bacterium]|nr:threonine/serine exporter family protein [Hyphomicrobiales bacterium]